MAKKTTETDGAQGAQAAESAAKTRKRTLKEATKDPVLWKDRKRYLGLPLSFTRYEATADRFITRFGFWRTETDEILLYRILDIKLVRTLGQKIFGVGTLTLFSADQTDCTLEIKNVKKPEAVRRFLSKAVERERVVRGIAGRDIYGASAAMHRVNAGPGDPHAIGGGAVAGGAAAGGAADTGDTGGANGAHELSGLEADPHHGLLTDLPPGLVDDEPADIPPPPVFGE